MPIDDERATGAPADHGTATGPVVEVVLPVYNEERRLEAGVRGLRAHLDGWRGPVTGSRVLVTIADNGSTDRTTAIARHLAASLPGVRLVRLEEKGRGRALRAVWSQSAAPVVAYMDVDLSTDLEAFGPLVAPLLDGSSDLVVGTRLAPGARVERSFRREALSRGYNALVHLVLRSRVSDAQCGFKAARREVVDTLLPLVADEAWFFDTELLVDAQRLGLRIREVPVTWVEDGDSTVRVLRTAALDLQGIVRLARHPVPRPSGPAGARRDGAAIGAPAGTVRP